MATPSATLNPPMQEMKILNKPSDMQAAIESEFKIVGDEEYQKDDDIFTRHPNKYYEFASKDCSLTFLNKLFRWMHTTELEMREAAGIKFAIIAAIAMGIVGAMKVEFFYEVSCMNYLFLQMLVSLGIFYLCCRQLDVLPFLEDEGLQFKLKVSAVASLLGVLLYVASWNYWPRQYSHFLICAIPLVENLREGLTSNFKTKDFVLLAVNYIGFFILLTITDNKKSFTILGLGLALGGVALFWYSFQELKALGSSNVLSIGMIITLVFSIFMPGFFGIAVAKPPSIIELLVIICLGSISSVAFLMMFRSIQITKPSHCLMAFTVALAIIWYVRTVNTDGFLFQGVIGVLLSVGCAVYILYEQQDKTTIMTYMTREPLIK